MVCSMWLMICIVKPLSGSTAFKDVCMCVCMRAFQDWILSSTRAPARPSVCYLCILENACTPIFTCRERDACRGHGCQCTRQCSSGCKQGAYLAHICTQALPSSKPSDTTWGRQVHTQCTGPARPRQVPCTCLLARWPIGRRINAQMHKRTHTHAQTCTQMYKHAHRRAEAHTCTQMSTDTEAHACRSVSKVGSTAQSLEDLHRCRSCDP